MRFQLSKMSTVTHLLSFNGGLTEFQTKRKIFDERKNKLTIMKPEVIETYEDHIDKSEIGGKITKGKLVVSDYKNRDDEGEHKPVIFGRKKSEIKHNRIVFLDS